MQSLHASGTEVSGDVILPKLLAGVAVMKRAWVASLIKLVVLSYVFSARTKL